MQKNWPKLLLGGIIVTLIILYFVLGLDQYVNFEELKARQAELQTFTSQNLASALAIYFVVYVLTAALSLPGAAILTLAGGAFFGFATGLVVVSFASSLGATLAFFLSRYLFRDAIQNRFGNRLEAINEGIRREGGFYLFSLRLVPLFPFFIVNLLVALTPIGIWRFYWISQMGMLPGTMVYVNAGTQLGKLESLSGILSPGIILSFVLVGILPLVAKSLLKLSSRKNQSLRDKP